MNEKAVNLKLRKNNVFWSRTYADPFDAKGKGTYYEMIEIDRIMNYSKRPKLGLEVHYRAFCFRVPNYEIFETSEPRKIQGEKTAPISTVEYLRILTQKDADTQREHEYRVEEGVVLANDYEDVCEKLSIMKVSMLFPEEKRGAIFSPLLVNPYNSGDTKNESGGTV